MNDIITAIYQQDNRRVFSTLVRLLGSFDAAEEALHDAFVAAAEQWPTQGVPANPVAWLVSTGRFKGIDQIRRAKRWVAWEEVAEEAEAIASAFLIATPAMAQRIVRTKGKIAAARIPYEVPDPADRPKRLASVLRVIYLIFNEAHSARTPGLADEAIRLARLLRTLLPEPEVLGLLALLLLHDARRAARSNRDGDLVALEEQDRMLWNRQAILEGSALAEAALSQPGFAAYALQAAIAALHGEAASAERTDWP